MNPSRAFSSFAIIVYLIGLLYCGISKSFTPLLILPLLFLLEPILLSVTTLLENIFQKKILRNVSLIIAATWFLHVLLGLIINFNAITKTNEDYGMWRIIFLLLALGNIYALKQGSNKRNNTNLRNILSLAFFLLFFLLPLEKYDKVILQSNPYGLMGFLILSICVIILTAKSRATGNQETKLIQWMMNYGFPLFVWFLILSAINTVYYEKNNIAFVLIYPAMLAHLNNGIFLTQSPDENDKHISAKQICCYSFIIFFSAFGYFIGSLNFARNMLGNEKTISKETNAVNAENDYLKREIQVMLEKNLENQKKQTDDIIQKRLNSFLIELQKENKSVLKGNIAPILPQIRGQPSSKNVDWAEEALVKKKAEADARKILIETESNQMESQSSTNPQQNP